MIDLTGSNVLRCLDCGKCTSACPVARYNKVLSPRRLMGQLGEGRTENIGEAVWACLTCMQCDTRCPQQVTISTSVPKLREIARAGGEKPPTTRCGIMESIAAIQSQAAVPQNRLDWLTDDLKTDPESKTMLWVGCAPYFDTFFAENGVNTLQSVISAIKILNALDIEPAVLADERCCGHDALWSGDQETFKRLSELNVKLFEKLQPELVVTVCPECSMTLIKEYQRLHGVPTGEVKHISEVIVENADRLPLQASAQTVTFQDPCRLGRHQQKYDEPRQALAAVPELELKEMARSRRGAVCCAGSWLVCNQATKRIQTDRLKEAVASGGESLVTACPKCLVHYKCAQTGDESVPKIEIRDLATVVADALNN
ncbi:MAG: (Fe-S)-binding protein [bacterium]